MTGRTGWLRDPGRMAGVILLVCSTAFLIALDAPWWSSNSTYLAPTSAEVKLQRAVGSSIVGFGSSSCLAPPTLGIQAEVNIVYGVHELDSYDPLTPKKLYASWARSTRTSARPTGVRSKGVPISMFCPVVRTTAAARLFGVGFVLEPHGAKGPPGSVFDTSVGGEGLYRIPASSVATLSPLKQDGALPPAHETAAPLRVTFPSPTSWKVVTSATTPQVLRLRLTDVPG